MVKVITKRCQPWLYKKAECRLCVNACPVEGCIRFESGNVTVSAEQCIGCGICTTVCPTGALVMESLSDNELLDRLQTHARDKDALLLGCYLYDKQLAEGKTDQSHSSKSDHRNYDPPKADQTTNSELAINLPCLALLKESHLISLALSGIKDITLNTSRCKECAFQEGSKTIDKTAVYARSLLAILGRQDRISLRDTSFDALQTSTHPTVKGKRKSSFLSSKKKNKKVKSITITPGPEYSRRELLFFLREKAVDKAAAKVGVKREKTDTTVVQKEHDIPERRTLLFEALKGVNNNAGTLPMEVGSFPVHDLRIDKGCTLCNICTLMCPTSAIVKVAEDSRADEKGEVRIDFRMSRCMDCYQCAELCPEGVLHKEKSLDISPLFADGVKTLFRKARKACPTCSSMFYTEEGVEQCAICRKKNKFDEMFAETLYSPQTLH